eukprot:CCRYP_009319-RF/>CCRYP_009319-RF protein AED:0.08 eAED:0.08 QI:126/0.75/0.8/1/0.75/0.8/5/0/745
MAGLHKDKPLPLTQIHNSSSLPLNETTLCQIRRRSDLFLLWIGVCIVLLCGGHIYMHNPHVVHIHELDQGEASGVHGRLKGFVVDSRKVGKAGKVRKVAKSQSEEQSEARQLQAPDSHDRDSSAVGKSQSNNSVILGERDVVNTVSGDDDAANGSTSNSVAVEDEPRKDQTDTATSTTTSTTTTTSSSTSSTTTSTAKTTTTATSTTTSSTSSTTTTTSHSDNDKSNGINKINHKIINPSDSIHPVAHLSCTDHGGPFDPKIIDEMVFWSDIPSDASYVSPMYEEGKEKFLTFEPDHGGWNNIRMAMETALVMSHAMGRTLVLPPEQGMYLIDKNKHGQKSQFGFNDFFHLDAIAVEHKGFKVITTEEFLQREGITGRLKDRSSGQVLLPPENRTNWNNLNSGIDPLHKYLRTIANTPEWDPWECALAIPSSKGQTSIDELNSTLHSIMDGSYGKPKPTLEEFNGNPTPVNASLAERMREMLADRDNLCIYDTPLQEEKVIHLKVQGGVRLLTHFYAFIFFADWRQDVWSKRFVRDHLRYVDEIVCAAARVVEAVREHARKNKKHKPSMEEGVYDAMHVRRGDFQYTPTRLPADELYALSKNELSEGATLYVATDETDKSFFEPFKQKYDVVFLDDFMHVIPDQNTNYYGMIDQLVSYKSRVFYGTWWSTLSGYVNRMRGYYITKHKLEGWQDGTMKSWYFTPEERLHQRLQMRTYIPVRKPIYCKEFAIAWRDIDQGIDELSQQ